MASFDKTTFGKEVVLEFQNKVKGKTCTFHLHLLLDVPVSDYSIFLVVVITGPSAGGLGAQTAIFLAQAQPAEIILLGRTESKVTSVIDEIKSTSPETSVKFIQVNLDSFSSIRSAADAVNKSVKKIDVLINNAGIMYVKDFTLTGEGIEAHLSSNHVGHFLLTNLLLPKILAAGKGARIVNLTSSAHVVSPMRFNDYHFDNGRTYDPWLAYGQSKTANILFTTALAAKLASKGILAFAVHPGIITTNLASHIDYSEFPKLVKLYEDNGTYQIYPPETDAHYYRRSNTRV
jgi:NAD(P)-dependent dehydrogenase (short-subunit alcohol dehydrogenase family)